MTGKGLVKVYRTKKKKKLASKCVIFTATPELNFDLICKLTKEKLLYMCIAVEYLTFSLLNRPQKNAWKVKRDFVSNLQ